MRINLFFSAGLGIAVEILYALAIILAGFLIGLLIIYFKIF
jgi:hypothetical protein